MIAEPFDAAIRYRIIVEAYSWDRPKLRVVSRNSADQYRR